MSANSLAMKRQRNSFAVSLHKQAQAFLEQRKQIKLQQAIEQEPEKTLAQEPLPREWTKEQVDKLLKLLDAQEERLVQGGFHRMSKWWRFEIERFLRSGKNRWIIRVGRRGGKSTSLCRLFVAWARSGMWAIGPGEVATIPIVSKNEKEAADRLLNIRVILQTMGLVKGEDYTEKGMTIQLVKERMEFRVYAATVIVGCTAIAFFGDEVAHWESSDTAKYSASKVMESARPSMATQPLAFEILASAPWGTLDYHAKAFDEGETDSQLTSYAPTWVANDNYIPEARTHKLEPDPKSWAVAYKAIPGSTISAAFDKELVLSSFRRNHKGRKNESGYVSLDPSELREDAFAAIAGHTTDFGELLVEHIQGWEVEHITPDVDYDTICSSVKALADEFQTGEVYGDQLEQGSLKGLLGRRNKHYEVLPWTRQSKHDAITLLRRLMRTGKLLIFEDHPKLKKEMLECKAEKTPSGDTRYETNGLDYLSALITTAHAINENHLKLHDASGLSEEDLELWAMGMPLERVGGL
jgi:hypothetical protein